MKCINSIEDLLALSFFSLYRSARRDMFLVCSVASVIKESINMAKKENTWTMISHWLPITTPPIWGHLNVHVGSKNLVCNVATTQFLTPTLFPFLKSHRYPEQHDKNNNALFTGQYIVTVQLSLAVDLWICFARLDPFDCLICEANKSKRKCSVMKTVDYNSVHKLLSNLDFSCWFLIIKQYLSMWLHYMLNSYHCTDCGILLLALNHSRVVNQDRNVCGFSICRPYKLQWSGAYNVI